MCGTKWSRANVRAVLVRVVGINSIKSAHNVTCNVTGLTKGANLIEGTSGSSCWDVLSAANGSSGVRGVRWLNVIIVDGIYRISGVEVMKDAADLTLTLGIGGATRCATSYGSVEVSNVTNGV